MADQDSLAAASRLAADSERLAELLRLASALDAEQLQALVGQARTTVQANQQRNASRANRSSTEHAEAAEAGRDAHVLGDDAELEDNLEYVQDERPDAGPNAILSSFPPRESQCPSEKHGTDALRLWRENATPPTHSVDIPCAPLVDPNRASSSRAPPRRDPLEGTCRNQCCRMAAVLRPDSPKFRYLLHHLVCVRPVRNGQEHPFASPDPQNTPGKLDWTESLAYLTLKPQGGKTQSACLAMWITWQLLWVVSLYYVKNNGGLLSAIQMLRDISNFSRRLTLLLEEAARDGVPGVDSDATPLLISAQRFPSNEFALWMALRHKRTCVFVDLFNAAKLRRARDALQYGAQHGGADSEGRLSVQLAADEVDATISSPMRHATQSELTAYQAVQPLCIKTLAISATPATALLTELQPGCVVEVPSHPHLVYVGLEEVVLRTQEDPAHPMSAATVTLNSLPEWMERYIGPMLQDMVEGVAGGATRASLLIPSITTVRQVQEVLAAEVIQYVDTHQPQGSGTAVRAAVLLLNSGKLHAPEYERGWRAVRVSPALQEYLPLLLEEEVCRPELNEEEQQRWRDAGCAPMTIHTHLEHFANVTVKRMARELALVHQHIALPRDLEPELRQRFRNWHLKFHDCSEAADGAHGMYEEAGDMLGEEQPPQQEQGDSEGCWVLFSSVLDLMGIITWLDAWAAAVERHTNGAVRVMRHVIAGNMADRGLTFKDYAHKQPLTDMFLAIPKGNMVDRGRLQQVLGRMFCCVPPESADFRPFFWGPARCLVQCIDAAATEQDAIRLTQHGEAGLAIAGRLDEQQVTYNHAIGGTLGKRSVFADGNVQLELCHEGGEHAAGPIGSRRRGQQAGEQVPVQFVLAEQGGGAAAADAEDDEEAPAAQRQVQLAERPYQGCVAVVPVCLPAAGLVPTTSAGQELAGLLRIMSHGQPVTLLTRVYWVPSSHPLLQDPRVHTMFEAWRPDGDNQPVKVWYGPVREATKELLLQSCSNKSVGLSSGMSERRQTEARACPLLAPRRRRSDGSWELPTGVQRHRLWFHNGASDLSSEPGACLIVQRYKVTTIINMPLGWYAWHCFSQDGSLQMKLVCAQGSAITPQLGLRMGAVPPAPAAPAASAGPAGTGMEQAAEAVQAPEADRSRARIKLSAIFRWRLVNNGGDGPGGPGTAAAAAAAAAGPDVYACGPAEDASGDSSADDNSDSESGGQPHGNLATRTRLPLHPLDTRLPRRSTGGTERTPKRRRLRSLIGGTSSTAVPDVIRITDPEDGPGPGDSPSASSTSSSGAEATPPGGGAGVSRGRSQGRDALPTAEQLEEHLQHGDYMEELERHLLDKGLPTDGWEVEAVWSVREQRIVPKYRHRQCAPRGTQSLREAVWRARTAVKPLSEDPSVLAGKAEQLRATQQQKLEDKLRAQGLPTDGWEAVVFSSPYDRKRRTGYIHNELAPPGEFILREMSEVIARTRRAQEGQQ